VKDGQPSGRDAQEQPHHSELVFLLQVPHLLGMSLLKEGELLVVVFQLGGEPGHFRVEVREGCI